MYSPRIVDRRLTQAKRAGLSFKRLSRVDSITISSELEDLSLGNGKLVRDLRPAERQFIESERLLCKADFRYYFTRYHQLARDPGVDKGEGTGPADPLPSQLHFLRLIGIREEEVQDEWEAHKHTEGIRVIAHKCRQVGFTALCRALTLHRMLFWPGTRAFAGTLEPDGCGELYKRDTLALDNLPFWLHPGALYPDVKDTEIGFSAPLRSTLRYQPENQKTGLGVGTQVDVSHLTEVPLWRYYEYNVNLSLIPALPKARTTLHVQEGTSAGKGHWWEVSESCRRRRTGWEAWTYIFVPWYANRTKWRAVPPPDWSPEPHTLAHASLIERTSPEWNLGMRVEPSREQLYWWETERKRAQRDGILAVFFNNYPATPEQSFTNWNEGAIPTELIERLELDLREPRPYEILLDSSDADAEAIDLTDPADVFPRTLYVGTSCITPATESSDAIEEDPRGLLYLWEPPTARADYIMSIDAAEGITGWSRGARREGDHKKDNSALTIWRVDGAREPLLKRDAQDREAPDLNPDGSPRWLLRDLQVAEYFAPIDAVDIARVALVLGRIYHGSAEDYCPLIWESYPGCGMLTTQELLRLGYPNLWHWEYIADSAATETTWLGWHSTPRSQRVLWQRARRHLMSRRALIRSKWTLDEFRNAETNMETMRARAAHGFHDDLFQSSIMAWWAAHKWTYNDDSSVPEVRTVEVLDFQRVAPSLDDHQSFADWKSGVLAGWEED